MKPLWLVSAAFCILVIWSGKSSAQYTSPNYSSSEVFFGSGGDNNLSSSNYSATGSVGSLGVGNFSSASYQAFSGFLTPGDPFLEFVVNTSTVDLGLLDSSSTKTATASFSVRAYLNSTYSVQTISQPPRYTSGAVSHTLTGMSSTAGSVIGTEQFGINLVHNTSPADFGVDPSPQPSSSFAAGQAASGYGTINQYKYVAGDSIAQSVTNGWGLTNYTISFIANSSLTTPAGNYTMAMDLVAVATY